MTKIFPQKCTILSATFAKYTDFFSWRVKPKNAGKLLQVRHSKDSKQKRLQK